MSCLVVLMIEAEQPEGLSARKLVVETAKHNVITAYTAEDGLILLQRFPNVDVIFVHAAMMEHTPTLLAAVRELAPDKPIIIGTPFAETRHPLANFTIDSHDPQELLRLLTHEIPPLSEP